MHGVLATSGNTVTLRNEHLRRRLEPAPSPPKIHIFPLASIAKLTALVPNGPLPLIEGVVHVGVAAYMATKPTKLAPFWPVYPNNAGPKGCLDHKFQPLCKPSKASKPSHYRPIRPKSTSVHFHPWLQHEHSGSMEDYQM